MMGPNIFICRQNKKRESDTKSQGRELPRKVLYMYIYREERATSLLETMQRSNETRSASLQGKCMFFVFTAFSAT